MTFQSNLPAVLSGAMEQLKHDAHQLNFYALLANIAAMVPVAPK